MLSKKTYQGGFAGYHIVDCAIRARDAVAFALCESSKEKSNKAPSKRVLNYFLDGSEDYGYHQVGGFDLPVLTIAHKPKTQSIMLGSDGAVVVQGGGDSGMEEAIPVGLNMALESSVKAVTTIDGHVYAVGGWRSVCRRTKANTWENMVDRAQMPMPKMSAEGLPIGGGFRAIAAFGPHDIYCAGGEGDVWRFDGVRWRQCPLPTNMLLHSICCAGDGFVYIGAESGCVIRGRNENWEVIHRAKLSLPYKDMVWYQNKVWCTSDYGIWVIEDGKVVDADLPAEIRSKAGNLAVGDGVMLLAGVYGAALYDGQKWEVLIDVFAFQ